MKFTVRTLDKAGFQQAASDLARQVQGQPQLVIGIRSGGYALAQAMLPGLPGAQLLPITCRRPSTEAKQASPLKAWLRKLPRVLNDALRLVEHMILTQWRTPRPGHFIPDADELSAIEAALQQQGITRILVVDDAVDSGATLQAVLELLKRLAPTAAITSAVITVTTDAPLVQPDVMLYRYTLCRFPWSLDAR